MRLARPPKRLGTFQFRVRWVLTSYDENTTMVRLLGRDSVTQDWVYYQTFYDDLQNMTPEKIRRMKRGNKIAMKRHIHGIYKYTQIPTDIAFCEKALDILDDGKRGRAWRKSKSKNVKRPSTR